MWWAWALLLVAALAIVLLLLWRRGNTGNVQPGGSPGAPEGGSEQVKSKDDARRSRWARRRCVTAIRVRAGVAG
jgi:hypothetical protein